jgi:parallel beta-helix repeat protein
MNTGAKRGAILALVAGAFLSGSIAAANPEPRVVQVNCSNGKTLAKALERGNEDRPLLVLVQGVCNETVTIERSDVTLRGEAGAAINGPDAALDTLTVRADRVTIENLVVSGGRNGIVASGAGNVVIRGTTVQSTGRTGILVVGGSGAIIDASTVQSNPRDGVSTEGSQVTIMNSTVRQNARTGVLIATNTSGRIGLDPVNEAAGNTITQNGGSGVSVTAGGSALIGNNSITFNGTDPASIVGRSGISVTGASADILGGNTVANNAGQGIFLRGASVTIGSVTFPFTSVNTISGNGSATAQGGVSAFLGSSLVVRDAVITGNQGTGVVLSTRSVAQIFNTLVQGTVSTGPGTGDGIRLVLGSSLLPTTPASVVTGNAGAGISCFGDSAAVNTVLLGSAGNGAPDTICNPF